MNCYEFLRIYTDLVCNRADPNDLSDLYAFLSDRAKGTSLEKYFLKGSLATHLDHAIGIDAVANAIQNDGDSLLQKFFPDASVIVMKSALDRLAGYELYSEVGKYNQNLHSDLFASDEGLQLLEKMQIGRTTREDIADAIGEYEKLYKAGIASPAEILTLARYYDRGNPYEQVVREKGLDRDENKPMVIGGPASVEMVDKQGHLITSEALDKAFDNFMRNFRTRNLQILHSNVQAGWALPAYINENGEVYRSGVDEKGLWLIGELRDDITIAKRVREAIEKGQLKSYSIAGSAKQMENVVKGTQGFVKVTDLDLAEVTLCEKGINQGAHFDVLKSDTKSLVSSPEKIVALSKAISFSSLLCNGVILEKSNPPVIVICADRPNTITDAIFTSLRKAVPPDISIVVRNVPYAEWQPLLSLQTIPIEKQSSLEVLEIANYRPSSEEAVECHVCAYFVDGGYCTRLRLPVKEEYVCDYFQPADKAREREKWAEISHQPYEEQEVHHLSLGERLDRVIGLITLGFGSNRVTLPNFQFSKGGKMSSRLADFINWSDAERKRRKQHRERLEEFGFPDDAEFDEALRVKQPKVESPEEDWERSVRHRSPTQKDAQRPSSG